MMHELCILLRSCCAKSHTVRRLFHGRGANRDAVARRAVRDLVISSRSSRHRLFAKPPRAGVPTAQRSIPAAFWRGGTSRAVIFQLKDLPLDQKQWPSIFLRVFGSPDEYCRQLDGLGMGISSLSKVCIASPSQHPSADVDYTFAAIGISSAYVDFSGNCGNMAAAIGPFAYNHGFLPRASESSMTVRIHNTNTSKLIHSSFPLTGDGREAATSGRCAIAGVPGFGAEIKLNFLDSAGSKTGALLPTGNVVDQLDGIEASCVDFTNPCVFVRATDVGMDGTELPDEIIKDKSLLQRLEKLRCLGANAMKISRHPKDTPRGVPKIVVVRKPTTHKILGTEELREEQVDLVARVISFGQPHEAVPLTAAVGAAASATIKDSVVDTLIGAKRIREGSLTVGHPSGAIQVSVEKDGIGNIKTTSVIRTARPLMEGVVYY